MKKNMVTISIGICAYNEEKNIKNIIRDIFMQYQNNWKLHEVIIYTDGCSDKTVEEIRSLKNKKIKLLENKKREGKSYGLNRILDCFSSDIVTFFDADVRLKNKKVIDELIIPFTKDIKIMLVGGNTKPFYPKTFFQRAVYSTFAIFYESRKYVKDGNNIFGCTGGCMALRKKFAKEISMKSVINDDDYIYFTCLKKKYKFLYVDTAEVFYKLPQSTKDYLRQCFRSNPAAAKINMSKYFGKMVAEEYARPKVRYYRSVIREFIKNPIGVLYIIILNSIILPFQKYISANYRLEWFTAHSTK